MALARALVVFSLVTACGSSSAAPPPPSTPVPPAPPPAPPPTPVAAPMDPARAPFDAALTALSTATAIRVTEGWMGLVPAGMGPIAHHYELSATDSGFVVHLVCRAGEHERVEPDQTIPRESLTPILAQLTSVEPAAGTYTPRIEHTDDYPNLSIELDSPSGTLAFMSRSQGGDADPWQIALGSDTAIVASPIPGQALHAFGALVGIQRCRDWVSMLRQ